MPYTSIALDTLPKRLSRGRPFDEESAKALLEIVTNTNQGASDGVQYDTAALARAEAGKARRLLVKVAPDPELVKSRVYETAKDSGKFSWTVSLATEKPSTKKSKK